MNIQHLTSNAQRPTLDVGRWMLNVGCSLRSFGIIVLSSSALSAAPLEYNRDIRPILSENCFACHGPDSGARKASLRLDRFEDATSPRKEGKPAIVCSKPDESELVRRIFTSDQDDMMPPPESHKKLTDTQKNSLKQWIAEGAKYQPHWAYMKIVRPPIPALKDKWVRNPIDAFILQNLLAKNVKPSSEAEEHKLFRRLSLDLTGLPPTSEELNAFLKDNSPKAYERQVDRLLASPHFGERMAVAWLDLVRFADTVGYHADQPQNNFPFRDYVIDSFNRNKSFAQFTIEQIAGDLLPKATEEQRIATCFNRLNMMTREGGTQPKEYFAKYTADRVRTVAGAWLGSTMGCAECHDHKYDPISTKDFYSMGAFFADIKQWGMYGDYAPYNLNPELRGHDFDHFYFPPEIEVDNRYLHERREKMLGQAESLITASATKLKNSPKEKAEFEQWRRAGLEFLKQNPGGWLTPKPEVTFKMKDTNALVKEHFIFCESGKVAFTDKAKESIQLTLPVSGWIAAVCVEVVPRTNAITQFGQWPLKGATIQLTGKLKPGAGKERKLSWLHAEADRKEQDFYLSTRVVGVKDKWRTTTNEQPHTAVYILENPFKAKDGDLLQLNLGSPSLVSVRISVSPFAGREPLNSGLAALLSRSAPVLGRSKVQTPDGTELLDDVTVLHVAAPGEGRAPASNVDSRRAVSLLSKSSLSKNVNATYFLSTGWDKDAFAEVQKLKHEAWECRGGRTFVMVSKSVDPLTIRVLPRGNWQNESGEIVQPATPHFLPQLPNPENRRLNRLDLARWVISSENPLTARVFVNRLWKQFFGVGLSAVVDDLGAQGEWPVHPQLLDWLASEFRESGWDVKHVIKLIVMSSAYRQDSRSRPEMKDLDPNNRWVSFQSPRRLEAEFVRDNALTVAGLLNPNIGGPSAHPYQPAGYYANLQFPNREYQADKDEGQYRRGLYTHWQRAFLHPMLANFDAPAREECTANRTVSNTPQQGLTLLNDPTFVEASRVFAQRLLASPKKSDEERIDLAFQIALARPAKDKEKRLLEELLPKLRTEYGTHSDDVGKILKTGIAPIPDNVDKVELAVWANACRVVLNLHETITRY